MDGWLLSFPPLLTQAGVESKDTEKEMINVHLFKSVSTETMVCTNNNWIIVSPPI
jgi:hypothetical protein